jgi:hypothetical protein
VPPVVARETEGALDPVVRIGDGAPPRRSRAIDAPHYARVELVYQTGTTPHLGAGARGTGDDPAAVLTARREGDYFDQLQTSVRPESYRYAILGYLKQFRDGVQTMGKHPERFVLAVLSSLVIWAIDVATAVIVFYSFGITNIDFVLVLVATVAVSIGNLSKILPLTPGGIGLYEGVFTAFILAVTPLPWSIVLGIALLDHAIKNLVTVIGGFVSITAFNISLSQAAAASDEAQSRPPSPTSDE